MQVSQQLLHGISQSPVVPCSNLSGCWERIQLAMNALCVAELPTSCTKLGM